MYKAMASDVREMIKSMICLPSVSWCSKIAAWPQLYRPLKAPVKRRVFQGFASIREAYIHRFVRLDVYDTVYVFDIDQLKRLCRSVIVAFDVHLDGIAFSFDVVTGFDVFECDVLHCLPSVSCDSTVAVRPQL